jgi:hypothetical protein
MGALHSLHHLSLPCVLIVPRIPLLIHNPWHRELDLPMVCVAPCMSHVVTRGQAVSGGEGVSAVYSLHLLHRSRTPCAHPASRSISTNKGACLRDQGLKCEKGKTIPTHRGLNISVGQNGRPGEATNVKLHTLWNRRRHLGAMSLGSTTT